jgi:hypothetical protein
MTALSARADQVVYTKDNAPAAPRLEDMELKDSVSQYGITWTFDRPARVGQFITGDWYVVGPVKVTAIDPKPLYGAQVAEEWPDQLWPIERERYADKYARNGASLNPPLNTARCGYDSRMADRRYEPTLFMAPPFEMKPGDALVATVSLRDAEFYEKAIFGGYGNASSGGAAERRDRPAYRLGGHNSGKPVRTAAVLTCLAAPPPADAFRPSYADRESRIYRATDLRRELLYSLPKPESTPDLAKWVRRYQRPWIDIVEYHYAAMRENTPGYGQYTTEAVSTAALMLHLDFPPAEKEPLLIGVVQYGIDLWGLVRAGYPGWMGHGGFGDGRKWSIIFAGIMLGDEDMASPNKKYPEVVFGEDTKTAFGKGWTGADVIFLSHPRRGPTATTSPELQHPSEWPNGTSEAYRRCCTSINYPGEALAARLMRAEKLWDHDAFFAYVDRWTTENLKKIAADMKAADKNGWFQNWWLNQEIWGHTWGRTETSLQHDMWERYRNNLPPAKAAAR